MLRIGEKVPDFTLPTGAKDGRKEFSLSKALGEGDVVLAFFPLAFTGVCTREMCDFRDSIKAFEGLRAKVFGFSTDTPFTNEQFAKAQDLAFPIISDPNRDVVPRIWATATVAGVHNCAKRGVLVLDRAGVVKYSWITDDPKVWDGVEAVKKAVSG